MKLIGAAGILAAGEELDKGKFLANAYKALLGTDVKLLVALDSKDLFKTFSARRNFVDRSNRGDASVIPYELETDQVNRVI